MQSHDEYEFSFPPGSMGLELEPVIKSSERELGCRVKDFYFGEDYDGIPQEKLQDMVHVGDIICSVNGIGVKSLPFVEVVDQLRNLKNQSRIIRFKNIAASCNYSFIHSSSFDCLIFCFYCRVALSNTNSDTW